MTKDKILTVLKSLFTGLALCYVISVVVTAIAIATVPGVELLSAWLLCPSGQLQVETWTSSDGGGADFECQGGESAGPIGDGTVLFVTAAVLTPVVFILLWIVLSLLFRDSTDKPPAQVVEAVPDATGNLVARKPEPPSSAAPRLRELERLRAEGLISDDEYQQNRQDVLKGL